MRQGKNYNWLAFLGMFVVVVLVVYALSVFGDESDEELTSDETSVSNEIEVREEYVPKLEKIEEEPEATADDNVGEADQEEIVVEGGSTNSSFPDRDASLEENKNTSRDYEDSGNANFDQKD